MSTHAIQFCAESHTYEVDGLKRLSVTQVLQENGLYWDDIPEEQKLFGQDRGKKVHEACRLLSDDLLDEFMLDQQIEPYVQGKKNFMLDTGFMPMFTERPMFNPIYGYCGTPDEVGFFPDGSRAVVDLKCGGTIPAWVGCQLAPYAYFYPDPLTYKRIALRLHPDLPRNYKVVPFPAKTFSRDWDAFCAALTLSNWRRINL